MRLLNALAKAFEAFNEDGSLKNANQQEAVENLGAKVASILAKLTV